MTRPGRFGTAVLSTFLLQSPTRRQTNSNSYFCISVYKFLKLLKFAPTTSLPSISNVCQNAERNLCTPSPFISITKTISIWTPFYALLFGLSDFKAVSAQENRDKFVRDAFIRSISRNFIRLRLLEGHTLSRDSVFKQAKALEQAHKQSESYCHQPGTEIVASATTAEVPLPSSPVCSPDETVAALPYLSTSSTGNCYNCGNKCQMDDDRSLCPARGVACKKCSVYTISLGSPLESPMALPLFRGS